MPTKEFPNLTEEMNTAGSGAVAGIGVGPDGEPGGKPKHTVATALSKIFTRRQPAGLDRV